MRRLIRLFCFVLALAAIIPWGVSNAWAVNETSTTSAGPDTSGATSGAAVGGGPGSPSNSAVAVNTKSNSSVFRIAFSVARIAGTKVTPTNTAVAFASCSNCETVAVAIQVVLASNDANFVAPVNQAVAYNYQCTACDTFASAYQDLVMTSGPVHFTPTGNRDLASVRRQLQQLRHEQLTFTQLQTDVNTIEQQVVQVVATQLVSGRPPGNAGPEQPGTTPSDASTTTSSVPNDGTTSPSTESPASSPSTTSGTTSSTTTSSTSTTSTTTSSTSTTTADNGAGTTTTSNTTSTTAP